MTAYVNGRKENLEFTSELNPWKNVCLSDFCPHRTPGFTGADLANLAMKPLPS
jgi:ATP-dependent Zn protease